LLVERGTLRARRGDLAGAKEDYLGAVAAEPGNVQVHYFLGVVYQEMGDLADAKGEFLKTLEISPKYRDAEERLAAVNSK
jgi:protein O-mannosyl-transferase